MPPPRRASRSALAYRCQRGLTLLEVMVSALIVAVALLGLARLQANALAAGADSRVRTHALNASQSKMEELRHFANHGAYRALSGGSDSVTAANVSLSRSWTVQACPALPTPCRQRQVQVTTTWVGSAGTTQSVQLTSFIAEHDPVRGGAALL